MVGVEVIGRMEGAGWVKAGQDTVKSEVVSWWQINNLCVGCCKKRGGGCCRRFSTAVFRCDDSGIHTAQRIFIHLKGWQSHPLEEREETWWKSIAWELLKFERVGRVYSRWSLAILRLPRKDGHAFVDGLAFGKPETLVEFIRSCCCRDNNCGFFWFVYIGLNGF